MCVPVRLNSSRKNCTSSVRGSTARAYVFPLIFALTRTRGISSGIQMRNLHEFSLGALHGGLDGEFCQGAGSLALVFGWAAHVGLGLRDVHHRRADFLDGS